MDIELIGGISAVALIIAIVQLAKNIGFPAKYGGLLAVGIGLATSYGYTFFKDTPYFEATAIGLAIGLSASGLYSSVKNAKE